MGGLLICFFYNCDTDCTYQQATLIVEKTDGEEIVKIEGAICPEDQTTKEENENYYVLPIVYESAVSNGVDPYTAFEIGKAYTSPLTGINENSRHIIEVRDRSSLEHNLNNPYTTTLNNNSQADQLIYTGQVELTGHELQLMLALLNIDDHGGSKTWRIEKATWPDGSEITELDDWECILDNEYSFMKGRRMRYDPNGTDDQGLICNKELDYFDNEDDVTHVYGTYAIEETGTDLFINIEISTSLTNTYTERIKVVSYDWQELKVEVENDNGQTAVATIIPKEYNDNI